MSNEVHADTLGSERTIPSRQDTSIKSRRTNLGEREDEKNSKAQEDWFRKSVLVDATELVSATLKNVRIHGSSLGRRKPNT